MTARLLLYLGLLLTFGPAAGAVEILRWERLPLAIPLLVGQERVVFVERNVRVGVPTSISDRLRVQSAGGAVYLRASAPIEPTRVQLQYIDNGTVLLLDVAATPAKAGDTALEPLRIVDTPRTPARVDPGPSLALDTSAAQRRDGPTALVLTRYAAQSLYAPLRTVEALPGVSRANLRRDLRLDSLLPGLPVQAVAVAAWRLDDLWVTAVRLSNHSRTWQELDPRALQGDFLTATFQHATLGPQGRPEDTTTLYLVTRGHGLAQALLPAIQRFAPAPPQPSASTTEAEHAR
ncbi:integrating conjugative element protein, PFL_4704 family [Delftia tsuruhatensis]|uniref:TIGR03749 family integrating conjugative element protein n=1 Tax=Delftia tsuruhatensis TaxID=180282 RepID=UPI001E745CA7|nr:TIGR03749 family integrating conjugative element protein [Delftia tsuruhatensis]CAB5671062.1 integrating conjugative element protein, PFL_4704 family [Delftia tsuruhatensis]CAC9683137.1 integrating conjugative element protein, PFL_4704 family [Delftia tsuruhatensis]